MKKAAIYARVSTPDQHLENQTLRPPKAGSAERLRGQPRILRLRNLRQQGTPSRAGRR